MWKRSLKKGKMLEMTKFLGNDWKTESVRLGFSKVYNKKCGVGKDGADIFTKDIRITDWEEHEKRKARIEGRRKENTTLYHKYKLFGVNLWHTIHEQL